jgi:hypothetical protein
MMESFYSPCLTCIHAKENMKCDAFPKGIPNEILAGKDKHSKKHKDQNGDLVYKFGFSKDHILQMQKIKT